MPLNPHAEIGFGRASDAYERGRPAYPIEAVDHACAATGVPKDGAVLDVGAGTGKLTRLLAGRAARVVAVEPVDAMRAELAKRAPFAEALAGTAEALPLSDASVDAVFVAQAFHWFDGPRALAEIRRVLRPGGGLALVWNARDERVAWVAELTRMLDRHAPDAPRHRSNAWRAAFDGETGFSPLATRTFPFTQELPTLEHLVDRVASISFVASMDVDARAALLGEVRTLGAREDVSRFPYVTEVHVCRRVAA
ncbi:MAG TPA: class I SAM-dependent methyltransferase [Minicystis sp.]|nr:class I SAM-dependent methyltransferase [Minicystis sp.]